MPNPRPLSLLLLPAIVLLTVRCGGDPPAPAAPPPVVFRNPLLEAKPGEWARYDLAGGLELTQTVESVQTPPHGNAVVIQEETRHLESNRIDRSAPTRYGLNNFLWGFESAGGVVAEIALEEIDVAGRTWPCVRVDVVSSQTGRVRTWYSPEAPVFGMVRQVRYETSGEETVKAEINAWGEK